MADRNWKGKDWLGAAATLFALAVTFNAEYEIAIAVHIHPIVAYAVPGALDVYVLRALQVKRDVFLTVLAMVAVNAASHLVTAGVLAVSPALIVAVSAIAPLVLWRAHVLRHSASTGPVVFSVAEDDGHNGGVACTCSRCVPEACPYCDLLTRNMPEHIENGCVRWRDVPAVPEHVSPFEDVLRKNGVSRASFDAEFDRLRGQEENVPAFEEHADQAVSIVSPDTVNVSENSFETCPDCSWDWVPVGLLDLHLRSTCSSRFGNAPERIPLHLKYKSTDVHGPEDTGARVLSLVPPLPPEFPSVLEDGDKAFLDRARALPKLTFRALKELGMGNDRAARIKTYLEFEHKEERP